MDFTEIKLVNFIAYAFIITFQIVNIIILNRIFKDHDTTIDNKTRLDNLEKRFDKWES